MSRSASNHAVVRRRAARGAAAATAAVTAVTVLAGCAGSEPPATPAHRAAAVGAPAAAHMRVATASPRALRLHLEQLLGHHATLMIRLMRATLDGQLAFVSAADAALARNTTQLRDAVAQTYDQAAADSFTELWQAHVDMLVRYSRGVADEDRGAADAALADLDAYAQDYGKMISTLTDGELAADAVATDVAAHIDHIVGATDAYAAGDFAAAFEGQRTAYAAMFTTGKAVSGASVTQPRGELPAGFDSAPAQLRSALGRLLGEHVELAFDATRAVVSESPAARAAAEALNANTQEILSAMQGALGRRAATAFSDAWAAHIDAVVQFAVAVADGDEEAQSRARAALDTFPGRLQQVLTGVSGGQVAAEEVIAALKQHDQQLLQQVTAFAAADFETSHDLAYAGYEHMVGIADTVAEAIRGRTAGTAPRGGADTGGGGTVR